MKTHTKEIYGVTIEEESREKLYRGSGTPACVRYKAFLNHGVFSHIDLSKDLIGGRKGEDAFPTSIKVRFDGGFSGECSTNGNGFTISCIGEWEHRVLIATFRYLADRLEKLER